MTPLCGARGRSGLPCRLPGTGKGGRCKFHGGRSRGNPYGNAAGLHRGHMRRLAERQALGLPWFGGRPPKLQTVVNTLRKAESMADQAIAQLDAQLPAEDEGPDSVPAILREGMREGLLLGRDTVRLARGALARDGETVDLKILRAGNEAGQALCRLAVRAAEGEFRARKDDALEKLLQLIAAEKSGGTQGEDR